MMLWLPIVVSVATMISLAILVFWLVSRSRHVAVATVKNPNQAFADLCQALGADTAALNRAQVRVGNSSFSLQYQPPYKNTPPRLTVALDSPVGGAMPNARANPFRERPGGPVELDYVRPVLLRSETANDRFGKAMFLNREPQTGDAPFDERVYVETDAPDHLVLGLLENAEVRMGVAQLLSAGWAAVRFYDTTDNVALIANPAGLQHFDPARTQETFQQLEALGLKIPKVSHRVARRPPWSLGTWMKIVSISTCFGAWALAVIAGNVWSPVESEPYGILVAAGFGLWLVSAPLLGLLLRGRSDSLRTFGQVIGMLAVGIPPLVVGLTMTANGALDGSAAEAHTLQVQGLWLASGKSTSYHVRLAHWEPGREPLSFTISESTYNELKSGGNSGYAVLATHPGALGWTWWDGISRATN